jgi:amino-acid N-acetyltransferase
MQTQITIKQGSNPYKNAIVELLSSERLPVKDLPGNLDHFVLAMADDCVIAVAGLEQYDRYGLLRSLVVNKHYRNQKIADRLISQLEKSAAELGLTDIYLLTETAPEYFTKKGYQRIDRTEIPGPVQQSTEFRDVCPKSAIAMRKAIA